MKRRPGLVTMVLLLVAVALMIAASCASPAPTATPRVVVATPTAGPTPTPRVVVATPTPAPTVVKEKMPPDMIVFSSYEPGGAIYLQVAALAGPLQEAYGTRLRILPVGDDVGRTLAIQTGKAQFMATGIGPFFAFEGLDDFADPRWGPQAISLLWQVPPAYGFSMVTAKDAGITTPADAKGKRVSFVIGGAAINVSIEGWLAFAGLTWDDVKMVQFPGYLQSTDGLVKGETDASMGLTNLARLTELQASPRGIHWVEFPASDKEGWARAQRVAPYMYPQRAASGVGVPEGGIDVSAWPSPTVTAYTDQVSEELGYFLAKALDTLSPKYKDASAAMPQWEIGKALPPRGMAPYHPGVVKYLKEKGIWNAEYQQFQDRMLKKQQILLDTWEKSIDEATTKGLNAKNTTALWLQNRAEALKALD